MDKKVDQEGQDTLAKDRRDFLTKAGKVALGVPVTALLVSVTDKRARATGDASCAGNSYYDWYKRISRDDGWSWSSWSWSSYDDDK